MKDIPSYLVILVLLCTACIWDEETDGCVEYLNLVFVHNYSIDEFDDYIGNDIYFHMYLDDMLYRKEIIPYQSIKNGTPYSVAKEQADEIKVVAWAVPAGSVETDLIPDVTLGSSSSAQLLNMIPVSVDGIYQPVEEIYLGTIDYQEKDIFKESYAEINMRSCICRFTCSVQGLSYSAGEHNPRMELSGFKNQMDIAFQPQGENAIVTSSFIYNDITKIWNTGTIGLLPSGTDEYLSFILYEDNTPLLKVHTQEQSRAGMDIHLVILMNTYVDTEVVLTIDGWRVKNVIVERL